MTNIKKEVAIKNYSLEKMADLTSMSSVLKTFIVKNKLYTTIQGKNFCHADGWMFAGAMLGLSPRLVKTVDLSKDKEVVWMAEVEIVDRNEKVVSRGYALCSNKESKKRSFDDYAILSMAQTRAVSKGFRNIIGYVLKLSGMESTPAEEASRFGEAMPEPVATASAEPEKPKKGQVIGPDGKPTWVCEVCSDPITDQVEAYSMKVYKKRLCREHQTKK